MATLSNIMREKSYKLAITLALSLPLWAISCFVSSTLWTNIILIPIPPFQCDLSTVTHFSFAIRIVFRRLLFFFIIIINYALSVSLHLVRRVSANFSLNQNDEKVIWDL